MTPEELQGLSMIRSSGRSQADAARTLGSERHELKFLIRPAEAVAIAEFVEPYLELDKYCESRPNREYTVRSIYYDSPSFDCYHEKLDGVRERQKLRIRTYNQATDVAYLENKRKIGGTHHKVKTALSSEVLTALASRDDGAVRAIFGQDGPAQVLEQLLYRMLRDAYAPLSLVVYDREAYVYPGQHDLVRLTFDRNLRARLFPTLASIHSELDLEPLLYHWIILEIKFTGIIPRWVRRLNMRFDLRRQACSKFGMSVASLLGEAPQLKDGIRYAAIN
jgi:VTC domain